MDQDGATEDQVEGAEVFGQRVVDAHHLALHPGAVDLVSESKSITATGVREGGRPADGRIVQLALVVEIDCHDLRGATPLHLEGPETIPGPDVQHPETVQ